jgi:hypothetical protein
MLTCGRSASAGEAIMPAISSSRPPANSRRASGSTARDPDMTTLTRPKRITEISTITALIRVPWSPIGVPPSRVRAKYHTNTTAPSATVTMSSSRRCRSPRFRAPNGSRYRAHSSNSIGTTEYPACSSDGGGIGPSR